MKDKDSHDYTQTLKALNASAQHNAYNYTAPEASLLESFASPFLAGFKSMIHIEAPEFTSLCPITGQPDFATIVIRYVPGSSCVESKSLKLYLGSFRQHGEFHEACVQRIAADLNMLLMPLYLYVRGDFAPRGGIPFRPTVEIGNAP